MFLNTYSVRLICRIASTPEIKTYDNGQKQRCVFDASVNMGKDSNGQYIDRFVTLTFWGKDAEFVARYPKGHRIMVEGTEDYFIPLDRETGAPKMVTDQNGREKIQVKPQVSVSAWLSLDPLNTSNNGGGNNNQNGNRQNGGNQQNNGYQQNGNNRQGYANNQNGYGNQQGNYSQQAAPPANAPQQRNAAAPPTANAQQPTQYAAPPQGQTQYQTQGGMPYDNGMAYTDDGDLPF